MGMDAPEGAVFLKKEKIFLKIPPDDKKTKAKLTSRVSKNFAIMTEISGRKESSRETTLLKEVRRFLIKNRVKNDNGT